MNRYRIALGPYLHDMTTSFMFWVCLGAPIAFVWFNHAFMPTCNSWLSMRLGQPNVLVPYYEAIDAFVICTTATMVGYTGVLVVLDELDTGTASYYAITPIGKGGYLTSRLLVPVAMAISINLLVVGLWSLSSLSAVQLVAHTLMGLLMGMLIAVFVLAYAHNRIEGIALTKVGNTFILGIAIGALLPDRSGWPFMWLPTYWIGRFTVTGHIGDALVSGVLSVGWLMVMSRRFAWKLR